METYAKLLDSGDIQYFTPYHGGLLIDGQIVVNAPEELYNKAGWYKLNQIEDEGINHLDNNVIQYYVGKPEDDIAEKLNDTSGLIEALERFIAINGVTEVDRALAQERIQWRSELDPQYIEEEL